MYSLSYYEKSNFLYDIKSYWGDCILDSSSPPLKNGIKK